MRIVIDTNVLISGVFFGGFPRKILSAVVGQKITACATAEIINEYEAIVQEMIDRKQGHIDRAILTPLIKAMEIIEPITHIEICRDPDDDKFLGCAKDSHALYIVSGDKDLLAIEEYENIQIMTAKDFCEKYFPDESNTPQQADGVFDPRGIRQTSVQARLIGSLLAGIKTHSFQFIAPCVFMLLF